MSRLRGQFIPKRETFDPLARTNSLRLDYFAAGYAQERYRIDDYITDFSRLTLTEEYGTMPELLSDDKYGTTELWWAICLFNGIVDPTTEFVSGVEIKVPAPAALNAWLEAIGNPLRASTNNIVTIT